MARQNPPSPPPIDPNDALGAVVPDNDAASLLFFVYLFGHLRRTTREQQEEQEGRCSRGLVCISRAVRDDAVYHAINSNGAAGGGRGA